MESLNPSQNNSQKNKGSPNNNSNKKPQDTKSAGRPQMKDNNDDNEFATTPLKASFSVESNKSNDRDAKASSGSADKVDESSKVSATKFEQKIEAKMDDLAGLIYTVGEKIQRMGEALCRIGDKVENLPKFASRNSSSSSSSTSNQQH